MLESLVPLVDQELPTLPEHLHLPPGFGEVRVAQSVVMIRGPAIDKVTVTDSSIRQLSTSLSVSTKSMFVMLRKV
jgi:hypothetical protein